jgi:hypothetical protein
MPGNGAVLKVKRRGMGKEEEIQLRGNTGQAE